MSDFPTTNIPGLPAPLPAGETMLWQGAPRWTALARRLFHVRAVGFYFGLLAIWQGGSLLWTGQAVGAAAMATTWVALLAAAGIGVLCLIAWLIARTTVYTITSRRILLHFGVALPMTIDVPFRIIHTAGLKTYGDGTGDIPVGVGDRQRLGYLVLWPHARPWRLSSPEPMLRGIPNPDGVARLLSEAIEAARESGEDAVAGEAQAGSTRSGRGRRTPRVVRRPEATAA